MAKKNELQWCLQKFQTLDPGMSFTATTRGRALAFGLKLCIGQNLSNGIVVAQFLMGKHFFACNDPSLFVNIR